MKKWLLLLILVIGNVCYSANWVELQDKTYIDYDSIKQVSSYKYYSWGDKDSASAYQMTLKAEQGTDLRHMSYEFCKPKDVGQFEDYYYYADIVELYVVMDYDSYEMTAQKICFDMTVGDEKSYQCEELNTSLNVNGKQLPSKIAEIINEKYRPTPQQPVQTKKTDKLKNALDILSIPLVILGIIL